MARVVGGRYQLPPRLAARGALIGPPPLAPSRSLSPLHQPPASALYFPPRALSRRWKSVLHPPPPPSSSSSSSSTSSTPSSSSSSFFEARLHSHCALLYFSSGPRKLSRQRTPRASSSFLAPGHRLPGGTRERESCCCCCGPGDGSRRERGRDAKALGRLFFVLVVVLRALAWSLSSSAPAGPSTPPPTRACIFPGWVREREIFRGERELFFGFRCTGRPGCRFRICNYVTSYELACGWSSSFDF